MTMLNHDRAEPAGYSHDTQSLCLEVYAPPRALFVPFFSLVGLVTRRNAVICNMIYTDDINCCDPFVFRFLSS